MEKNSTRRSHNLYKKVPNRIKRRTKGFVITSTNIDKISKKSRNSTLNSHNNNIDIKDIIYLRKDHCNDPTGYLYNMDLKYK